jgi:uncharacterized protein DUF5753
MYVEWQRRMRAGLERQQVSTVPLYDKTKVVRRYENTVIPLDLPSETDDAVAARMARQHVLYTGDRRFVFVLEEQTLRTQVGSTEIMLGQLDPHAGGHVAAARDLGIIPALANGSAWPRTVLRFDERVVQIEPCPPA